MRKDVAALSALFAGSGVLHFAAPRLFESIVPPQLGHERALVYGSGVAELACSVLLAFPQTRRLGGLASAALLVAVFPANIQMAVDVNKSPRSSTAMKVGTLARLPLQVPLIRTALKA